MDHSEIVGFLLVNKPVGPTSFDCIRAIKESLSIKKLVIGHAGTLDPFAQGLLILALGKRATQQLAHLSTLSKSYAVIAKLGELRDTLDLTGTLIKEQPLPPLDEKQIREAIALLGSSYEQTPPIYSALKHNGRSLHQLARNELMSRAELELIAQKKIRTVHLHSVTLLSLNSPSFNFEAHVSKGTYIRSLANDIAQKLGLHATTYQLERLSVGPWTVSQASKLESLATASAIIQALIPAEAFREQIVQALNNEEVSKL